MEMPEGYIKNCTCKSCMTYREFVEGGTPMSERYLNACAYCDGADVKECCCEIELCSKCLRDHRRRDVGCSKYAGQPAPPTPQVAPQGITTPVPTTWAWVNTNNA